MQNRIRSFPQICIKSSSIPSKFMLWSRFSKVIQMCNYKFYRSDLDSQRRFCMFLDHPLDNPRFSFVYYSSFSSFTARYPRMFQMESATPLYIHLWRLVPQAFPTGTRNTVASQFTIQATSSRINLYLQLYLLISKISALLHADLLLLDKSQNHDSIRCSMSFEKLIADQSMSVNGCCHHSDASTVVTAT